MSSFNSGEEALTHILESLAEKGGTMEVTMRVSVVLHKEVTDFQESVNGDLCDHGKSVRHVTVGEGCFRCAERVARAAEGRMP
jgi:hypothetical protein